MQWEVTGHSNHTQLFVVINDKNFIDYEHSISYAFDGSMLYTVNITNNVLQAGDYQIQLCAHFDDKVTQESPPYQNCSTPESFTVSGKEMCHIWIFSYHWCWEIPTLHT